jgi:hypothetical protein
MHVENIQITQVYQLVSEVYDHSTWFTTFDNPILAIETLSIYLLHQSIINCDGNTDGN